jgi:hypothetical protein
MKAVRIDECGGTEVLKLVEAECPVPAPDEILVKVNASGVNLVGFTPYNCNIVTFVIATMLQLHIKMLALSYTNRLRKSVVIIRPGHALTVLLLLFNLHLKNKSYGRR